MDINETIKAFQGCPCGREHKSEVKGIYIESGVTQRAGSLLGKHGFPKSVLLVADENTFAAADGLTSALAGFRLQTKIYPDVREPFMELVEEVERLSGGVDGILSVGSGSLNDICRLAAARQGKDFAIYATAPSMDGFASCDAPIVSGGFKKSYRARQPSVILADTRVLAAAPARLKSAGFGDMAAKYIAMADWNISRAVTGEYYCERTAALSLDAINRLSALSGRVTARDEEAAGLIAECLIMTGLGMGFTGNSRPASGAEHVVSHYWDIMQLARGIQPHFHGEQVGVATLLCAKIYHDYADAENIKVGPEATDWDAVYAAYPGMRADIEEANSPSVMDQTSPEIIEREWARIRGYVRKYVPPHGELLSRMKRAGCRTDISEIAVSPDFRDTALKYHSYMRRRMTLMRLTPCLSIL